MEIHAIYRAGDVQLQTHVIDNQCAYTTNPDTGKPLTADEYLGDLGPGYACIPLEDALDQIDVAQELAYIKPWIEISEEIWNDALGVLPPTRWEHVGGIEFFQCSEITIGNITATYARVNGKCFVANRRTSVKYSDLAGEIGFML